MKRGALACMAALLLGSVTAGAAERLIVLDGSSTLYPLSEAVAREYQVGFPNAPRVATVLSGTSIGIERLCEGKVEIANASRAISAAEIERCRRGGVRFIELPVALDAIAVIVHPGNRIVDAVTLAELRRLWEPGPDPVGDWSRLREGLPARPIRLYGPDAGSGTTQYFAATVIGGAGVLRQDYRASEDDYQIVRQVAGDPDGLGFVGYSYASQASTRVRMLAVGRDLDRAIPPTTAAMLDGSYVPLTRPLFLYVNREAYRDRNVRNLVSFYLERAPVLSRESGVVALTPELYAAVAERASKARVGSVFNGAPPASLSVADLLALERK